MRIGLYDNKQSAKDRSHVHDGYHGFLKMGCCGIFDCAGIPLDASVRRWLAADGEVVATCASGG
jgi:hypothetical protein